MNKFNQSTINLFMDEQNINVLKQKLIKSNPDSIPYILSNMQSLVTNFIYQVQRDYLYSNPVKTPNIVDQLECLNAVFLSYVDKFIANTVYRCNHLNINTLDDCISASSRGIVTDADRLELCGTNTGLAKKIPDGRTVTSDETLKAWRYPRRPVELRDDLIGSINKPIVGNGIRDKYATSHYNPPRTSWFDEDVEYKESFDIQTKENFDGDFDQLDRLMSTPKIQLLNGTNCTKDACQPQSNVKLWADGHSFVDITDEEAYRRMMNKKTFRNYYGNTYGGNTCPTGCDNLADDTACQIPWFERRLYNRYYERDVDESVGGFEKVSFQPMAHDMSSLVCRINKQNPINYKNYNFQGQDVPKPY